MQLPPSLDIFCFLLSALKLFIFFPLVLVHFNSVLFLAQLLVLPIFIIQFALVMAQVALQTAFHLLLKSVFQSFLFFLKLIVHLGRRCQLALDPTDLALVVVL